MSDMLQLVGEIGSTQYDVTGNIMLSVGNHYDKQIMSDTAVAFCGSWLNLSGESFRDLPGY